MNGSIGIEVHNIKASHKITVGAGSQCYWDELMLLKCEFIILKSELMLLKSKINTKKSANIVLGNW